jgi:GR25 family glycosyltransferase involved in LPS biosynthesis
MKVISDSKSVLNQYFPEIWMIGLKGIKEREEKYNKRINYLKNNFNIDINVWSTTMVNAGKFIGEKLTLNNNANIYHANEFGVTWSHLSLINLAYLNNWERILILEDDVRFHKDIDNRIGEYLENVPDDWNFLFLAGSVENFNLIKDNFEWVDQSKKIWKAKYVCSGLGYAISRKFYKKILDYYNDYYYVIDEITMNKLPKEHEGIYCVSETLIDVDCNINSSVRFHNSQVIHIKHHIINQIWDSSFKDEDFI